MMLLTGFRREDRLGRHAVRAQAPRLAAPVDFLWRQPIVFAARPAPSAFPPAAAPMPRRAAPAMGAHGIRAGPRASPARPLHRPAPRPRPAGFSFSVIPA